MDIITHSIYAKLKQCKHQYILDNIDKNLLQLIKELYNDIQEGNEQTVSKIIGKDCTNLIKLLSW